ncbi:MAG: hypothetical protein MI810_10295 [Flavobacteriales bacterium]|nr:hypothetical protein [Flavobacteriales bacterium]
MSDYLIKSIVEPFDTDYIEVISITLTNEYGPFRENSLGFNVSVDDGTNQAQAFMVKASDNQKEIIALFTTDAFNGFGPSSTLQFAFGDGEILEEFPGVNVLTELNPLDSLATNFNATNADSAWLASIS